MVKIYLWLIIVLFTASALGRFFLFFTTSKVSILDLAEASLGIINSAGIYGYLYKKYILPSYFWYFIIFLGLLFGIYNIFLSPKTIELIEKVGMGKSVLLLGGSYILTAPHLYFLFLYAKNSIK